MTQDSQSFQEPRAAARAWAVALPLPLPAYDFAPPHGFAGPPPVGCRVLVPWQGRPQPGVVVGPGTAHSAAGLREVLWVADPAPEPHLSPAFLAALGEQSKLSRVPLGLLLETLWGVGAGLAHRHRVRAVPGADLSMYPPPMPDGEWADAARFGAAALDSAREQGLLEEDFAPLGRRRSLIRAAAGEAGAARTLTPKQAHALAVLRADGPFPSASAWAAAAGVSGAVTGRVLLAGAAESFEEDVPLPALPQAAPAAPLSGAAAEAAASWLALLPDTGDWRLHGGRAGSRFALLGARVREILARGGSVLLLAPTVAEAGAAFAALGGAAGEAGAACLHGGLSEAEREAMWAGVKRGELRLLVGTGLALGAPLPGLELLVILEDSSEHHKLQGGGRLYLPQLAARVARRAGAALAQVGAVPAVESLPLPGVVLPPPRARLHAVNLAPREAPEFGPLSLPHHRPGPVGFPLSHALTGALRQVAERGRQAALLTPRRGYSALLRCQGCDAVPMCPHCDVPLRFHREAARLRCHQCGYAETTPERCAACGGAVLGTRGPGSEWIAAEVAKLLPGVPVWRFDTELKDDLSALQAGESGVLVGTTALLGLPAPPDLALVGVTLADTWLQLSDFRADERYHATLRRLAEWHPGRAPVLLVQTFQTEHPALLALAGGEDAAAYPARLLQTRRTADYPPFTTVAELSLQARDAAKVETQAGRLAAALYAGGAESAEVLGPAPRATYRLRGMYAQHLLLRVRSEARLQALLEVVDRFPGRVRVDIAPRGWG